MVQQNFNFRFQCPCYKPGAHASYAIRWSMLRLGLRASLGPAIKLYERESYFLHSMNSLEIQDTVQKRRIYGCFNRSLITIRLTQLLASYPTRSEQCRLAKTRTASTSSWEYALIQAVRFGSLSENLKKIIPDTFVNRFVQFITQKLTGILSTNPFLWQ